VDSIVDGVDAMQCMDLDTLAGHHMITLVVGTITTTKLALTGPWLVLIVEMAEMSASHVMMVI